uniref:MYC binding protein n=1 Tax=Sinocyclocheilus rhinocerous TaxID=307959 RepID=A0A673FRB2_9TELE
KVLRKSVMETRLVSFAMAHHTVSEARREQFRRTPDQSTEHLLFFLVALYEDTEKPNNASDFIKHQLGVGTEAEDAESLRLKLNTLQQKYDQLMEENKELRSRDNHVNEDDAFTSCDHHLTNTNSKQELLSL